MRAKYVISIVLGTVAASLLLTFLNIAEPACLIFLSPLVTLFFLLDKSARESKFVGGVLITYSFLFLLYDIISHSSMINFDMYSFAIAVYFVLQLGNAFFAPKLNQNAITGFRTTYTGKIGDTEKINNLLSVMRVWTLPSLFVLIFLGYGAGRFLAGVMLFFLPQICSACYSGLLDLMPGRAQVSR